MKAAEFNVVEAARRAAQNQFSYYRQVMAGCQVVVGSDQQRTGPTQAKEGGRKESSPKTTRAK